MYKQKRKVCETSHKGSLAVLFALRRVILLRSYIMLSHSDIVLRTVFRANKITLRLKGVISLSQSENITYLSFCCKKGLGITQKETFALTNMMLILSDMHKKSLDEIHRGFNLPYKK